MTGTLHLLPVALGDAAPDIWLTAGARDQAARLRHVVAENAKSARAFLKQVGTQHALPDITVNTLDARTTETDLRRWLAPLLAGEDVGLVSDAGCPAVADPGARLVAMAHTLGLPVRPWVGPSSLLLGLMASGLEGQRFTFHGYAPVPAEQRAGALRDWERESARHDQTQILIETPYRNSAMFDTLRQTLQPDTRLCVARALTTPAEWVRTLSIAQWREHARPELDKLPTVFLFLAAARTEPAGRRATTGHPSRPPGRHASPGRVSRPDGKPATRPKRGQAA